MTSLQDCESRHANKSAGSQKEMKEQRSQDFVPEHVCLLLSSCAKYSCSPPNFLTVLWSPARNLTNPGVDLKNFLSSECRPSGRDYRRHSKTTHCLKQDCDKYMLILTEFTMTLTRKFNHTDMEFELLSRTLASYIAALGGLLVIVLATGTKVSGLKPVLGGWVFKDYKIRARLPSERK